MTTTPFVIQPGVLRYALAHYGFSDTYIEELMDTVKLVHDLPSGALLTKVGELNESYVGCRVQTITRNEEQKAEGFLDAYHLNGGEDSESHQGDMIDTEIVGGGRVVLDGKFIALPPTVTCVVYAREVHGL